MKLTGPEMTAFNKTVQRAIKLEHQENRSA
jgi:hypothetical protein